MAMNSAIEWTDHTFNPWIGCSHVSEGCRNCYAETLMDTRLGKVEWGPGKPRVRTSTNYWRQPLQWNTAAKKTGVRARVFCASLADWLDPEAPNEWRSDLLDLISATPYLDWLLLTKRPENFGAAMDSIVEDARTKTARAMAAAWLRGDFPPNAFPGTSIELQKHIARRCDLVAIPSRMRFLSCEPLLGALSFSACGDEETLLTGIDWVICGGESGSAARPMHPDWARGLRDQCVAESVPFFFKQWGSFRPVYDRDKDPDWVMVEHMKRRYPRGRWLNLEGGHGFHGERVHFVAPLGKTIAPRALDDREWNEMPLGWGPAI